MDGWMLTHHPSPQMPHASDALAACAGLVAAGSWVVAAGAAAPTTAPPAPGKEAFLCDDAVSHLRDRVSGKEIYLIGTAHISNASAQVWGGRQAL